MLQPRRSPHVRNTSDDLLEACARTGGVVDITGVGAFLGAGADGRGEVSTETLLRHIDYAARLIGPEHVGLGLDYVFGVAEVEEFLRNHPDRFPASLRQTGAYLQVEPERFPVIAEGLPNREYSESDVRGIMGENNLRVARQVWR